MLTNHHLPTHLKKQKTKNKKPRTKNKEQGTINNEQETINKKQKTVSEILIQVEGVSKKFCKSLKRSLMYGAMDIGSELLGKYRSTELREDEFWAVRDVNFEVRRGECLGLIGHNGAGKSTLLKMLNGLIAPDTGRITMKGRIGALIELGTGFNPILTGRENVYNNGAVLGFSRQEIDRKFDAIVDFAEIGEFIDSPVQNYSSGMKVRLGFAVAAQMEPDVLIIDEVLAVGDLNFKLKCFNIIDQIVEKCAVIFVSHSMQMVSRLCSQIILMERGGVKYYGNNISTGIDRYYSDLAGKISNFIRNDFNIEVLKTTINNSTDQVPIIKRLDDLNINIMVKFDKEYERAVASIVIIDFEQKPIGVCPSELPIAELGSEKTTEDSKIMLSINIHIPRIQLSEGIYTITLNMAEARGSKPLARINNIKHFQVISNRDVWPPLEMEGFWS